MGTNPAQAGLAKLVGQEDGPLICDVSKQQYEALEAKVTEFEQQVEAAEKLNERKPTERGVEAMGDAHRAWMEAAYDFWKFSLTQEPCPRLWRRERAAKERLDALTEKLWPECPSATADGWARFRRLAEQQRETMFQAMRGPVRPVRAFEAYLDLDRVLWMFATFFRDGADRLYAPCYEYRHKLEEPCAKVRQAYQDHLRQEFQERYAQRLNHTRLDYLAQATEIETAVAGYDSSSGEATYRNTSRSAAELVCTVWPEVIRDLGINMRQSLALAYPLDNSQEVEPSPSDPEAAKPWTESERTAEGYSDAMRRIWAAMMELARKDLVAGGEQRYLAYLQRLPELVIRVGTDWPEYHQLLGTIGKVPGGSGLKKRVNRYVELTERLLFWRGAASEAEVQAAMGSEASDPQPGPMFLVPTDEDDVRWKSESPSVSDRYDGQRVRVPRTRLFRQADGKARLVSPWLGRGLFVLPAQSAVVDHLSRAKATLADELATGIRPQPFSAPASIAVGTCAEGPFPAVVGKVVRIRKLPIIYSLAHLSDAETVLGEQRPLPRPADMMRTFNYLFVLDPLLVQTTGQSVRP